MNDDQLSEFEDQARRVGRKNLPPEWRSEILEAALGDKEDRGLAPETPASPFKAIKRTDSQDEDAVLEPVDDRERWEGRIRKAERRAMWSMAACLVVTLFVIVLLFRPRLEPRAAQSGTDGAVEQKLSARNLESGGTVTGRGETRTGLEVASDSRIKLSSRQHGKESKKSVGSALAALSETIDQSHEAEVVDDPANRTDLQFRADTSSLSFRPLALGVDSSDPKRGKTHPLLPPRPKSPPSIAQGGDDAGQTEEANGGFLIRDAAINDIFQMLAKRANKQYFHNAKVAGPEFNVSGHLNGGDPLQQMEELAFAHGLTLYQKGKTVYALNKEQLSQLPAEKLNHQLRSIRPDDIDKVKALVQPMLSPTGVANYEPKTHTITIIDSAHKVDQARDLLDALDKPHGQTIAGKDEKHSELAAREGPKEGDASKPPGPSDQHGDPFQPVGSLTVTPTVRAPAITSHTHLGQHSDASSWGDVSVAGGVFTGKTPAEGEIALDRIASRRGIALSGASSISGVSHDFFTGVLPSREAYEAGNSDYHPLSNSPDSSLAAFLPLDKNADNPGWNKGQDQETAEASDRPRVTEEEIRSREQALLGGVLNEAPNSAMKSMNRQEQPLADAGQATSEGQAEATISLIDRVPIVTTTINETEISNQVTEEVRYSVDTRDPVGDPATTREIGVTMGVTPTLLPDGTIQMKMRPRSAQLVEEIVSQSGNRYPRVNESMLESIARVPEGHSVVLGGFYGEVKTKDEDKVPLLGASPVINFFFKDKEAAKEPANLLFVATPTSINGKVVIETKILSVNSSAGGQTGVDWTSNLGAAGLPPESIRSLNSLFGIERTGEVASGATAASDGPIVLSPAQTERVLRALSSGGLVTQTSNPTLIVEAKEPAPIAQVERKRKTLQELEKSAAAEPYSTFSLHVSDVSFKLAKAALARGEWPAADQVRVEEFVNAFDYGDPAPNQEEKVACNLEQAAHPFLQQRNLLRVSMRTAALGRSADTPLRLTVLLDNSGSMERADRVESVKNAFQLLANQLTSRDQVTLIGFARTPRLLADRLPGNRVAELADVVESIPSEGGTNIELALELGIAKAKEQMLEGGQNRIILLTDGAVNLGNAKPEDLARLVEDMRQQEIAFDACGVGADGLNDDILESLTRNGDGRYYFLDRPEDADDSFARQIAGALRPAARNVKVQIRFNPNRVGRYKLYGFEKHRLKKEDFHNDSVDAAELAAEEAGNAIYQVEFLPEGSGEIGTVSVRFQDTESGRMIEREWTIPYEAQVPRLEDSAASLRLASGAALLGEKLKGSVIGESVEMATLGKLVNGLTGDFPSDKRVKDLVQMTNKARELRGE